MGLLKKIEYIGLAVSAGIALTKVVRWARKRQASKQQPKTMRDIINEKQSTVQPAEELQPGNSQ